MSLTLERPPAATGTDDAARREPFARGSSPHLDDCFHAAVCGVADVWNPRDPHPCRASAHRFAVRLADGDRDFERLHLAAGLFGMLADRFGGRLVMTLLLLACIVPTLAVAYAHSYVQLMICAFLLGLAGNGFSIGIAWNSALAFHEKTQGIEALGVCSVRGTSGRR